MIDSATFSAAYQKNLDLTTRFLGKRGARDPEEFAQAAWARAWEYRHQICDPGAISFWVKRIAINLYRESFRRHKSISQIEEYEERTFGYRQDVDSPIGVVQILALCPPRASALLRNYYLDGTRLHNLTSTDRMNLCRARKAARTAIGLGKKVQ